MFLIVKLKKGNWERSETASGSITWREIQRQRALEKEHWIVGRWGNCAFIYKDKNWTQLELKANHYELLSELGNGPFISNGNGRLMGFPLMGMACLHAFFATCWSHGLQLSQVELAILAKWYAINFTILTLASFGDSNKTIFISSNHSWKVNATKDGWSLQNPCMKSPYICRDLI